jgi:hypothetical protein
MRLPFEFAEPVDPKRVRPRPHPVAEVDPRRRDPRRTLRLGAPLDPCPPPCG